jgi:hypothetical protein
MLQVFKAVEEKRIELEELRIVIQATEIVYRQKGELHTADRLKKLENNLSKAIELLRIQP